MGVIYLKDKPEVESFSYAYVEDAEGALRRVAIDKMKLALGIIEPFDANITLLADNWVLSENGKYYTQFVTIDGTTAKSVVELRPTPEQAIDLMNDELTLFMGNDNGTIIAHCVNGTPSEDLTFEVRIREDV